MQSYCPCAKCFFSFKFLADLYPDTVSDIPATTADEWLSGRNAQPIMMSMQTGKF